jgi:hypothetical protein
MSTGHWKSIAISAAALIIVGSVDVSSTHRTAVATADGLGDLKSAKGLFPQGGVLVVVTCAVLGVEKQGRILM